MGRVLGFDIGDRWLGIAVGDEFLRIATPRPEHRLAAPGEALAVIRALIEKERAHTVVIGMPYTMRGETGPQAQAVEQLIASLQEDLPTVAIHRIDERLTSHQAAASQRATSPKRGRGPARDDSTAATLILQTWFDRKSSAAGDR